MELIETTFLEGTSLKEACDLCSEEPENRLLIEKPFTYIMNGNKYRSVRRNPLYMCLDCFDFEYRECVIEDIEEND